MHYTSWDRTEKDSPVLLAEAGPEQLAHFHEHTADVAGDTWKLEVDPDKGATATTSAGVIYRLEGRIGRDKRLLAILDGTEYVVENEASNNWVISDAQDAKVAQFSGVNSGVRKAILEFEGEATLPQEHVVALSWFARLLLEQRLGKSAIAIIATLVLASLVAVFTFLF